MEAVAQELTLRYLLELSPDVRGAMLLGDDGRLMAAAPERPSEQAVRAGAELVRETFGLTEGAPLELDVTVEGGSVFLVRESGPALLCVTGPFALPGLILHDMRVVLDDLRRGALEEPATSERGSAKPPRGIAE